MVDKRSDDSVVDPIDNKWDDNEQTKTKENGGGLQDTSTGTSVAEITQVLAALEKKQPSPQGEPSS